MLMAEQTRIVLSEIFSRNTQTKINQFAYLSKTNIRSDNMKNLLAETSDMLWRHGKSFDDILWVGTATHRIDIEKFKELSNTECDASAGDLLIVGDGWWLELYTDEWSGCQYWKYKTQPVMPELWLDVKALNTMQARALGLDFMVRSLPLLMMNGYKEEGYDVCDVED